MTPTAVLQRFHNLLCEADYAFKTGDIPRAQALHAEAGVILLNEAGIREMEATG